MNASTEAFEREVIKRSYALPVVVDFWAGWCVPCRVLGPLLEREAAARDGQVALTKVDVDANPELAYRYGVQGIPAVKAFRNGYVIDEFVGALPAQRVGEFLDRLIESGAAVSLLEELRMEGKWADVTAALDAGQLEQGLELLLERLADADPFERDRIHRLTVVLLHELGTDHPLAVRHRRRLAINRD